MKAIDIIGVALGRGARDQRCEMGPEVLEKFGLTGLVRREGVAVNWLETLYPKLPQQDDVTVVAEVCARLADKVKAVVSAARLPFIIGGDHSCAVGTWTGMRQALARDARIGLIWVDAHMDSHTPETSHSGALHGMPLACLLGYGDPQLVELGGFKPKLLPRDVCLIGVRSFESGEAALLQRLGVRVIMMNEVRTRGFAEVWQEAIACVSRETIGYGISIDLDALDPADAPGVGSPAPEGIRAKDLNKALCRVQADPRLLGVEIMEYNPLHDHAQKTELVVKELMSAITSVQYCHASHHQSGTKILRA